VLHGLLGLVPRPQEMPAEGQQASSVSLVHRLEGTPVAASDLIDQRVVAGESE
jgi:hypothetical protein